MISCAAPKFWAWQSALLSQCGPGALGSKVEIGRVATVLDTAWSSQTKSNKCARTFEDYRLLWVKLVMSRLSLAEAELIEYLLWPIFTEFDLLKLYFHVILVSPAMLKWLRGARVAARLRWLHPARVAARGFAEPTVYRQRLLDGNEEILTKERRDFRAGNLDDEFMNWGFILKVSVKPSMIRATTKWQWTWSSWQWSQNWLDFSCCWFTICFLMKEVTWSH